MKLVDGIDISRRYTIEEVMEMYYAGRLRKVAVHGYVVRADSDGTVGFIPWWESALGNQEKTGSNRQYVQTTGDWQQEQAEALEAEHPMVRTSPQEKVARMALRIMAEAKRNGGVVPGLTDADVSRITGESWKAGESHITMEQVRRVAAHFLGIAEVDNRDADKHRTTRAHPLA